MTIPPWLIKRIPKAKNIKEIRNLLSDSSIETVCENAKCPNIGECYAQKTLTFMILGNTCTRNCQFCTVSSGNPSALNPEEPKKVAQAARKLGLKYVVITSITRDDLEDGGAEQFATTIQEIKKEIPGAKVEVLIPDFRGSKEALKKVLDAEPAVLNHNIEVIPRLYPKARSQANYQRSLKLLEKAKKINGKICTKSGLMVGLGENFSEVIDALKDLRRVGCNIITIGQYLQPSSQQIKVEEYIKPEIFAQYKEHGEKLGFKHIEAGPFVRSSYQAHRYA